MNINITTSTTKFIISFFYRILTLLLFLVLVNAGSVGANVLNGVTFTWRANPADDYVIGYRLYYNGTSRFTSNGEYDYYIDFATKKRCVLNNETTSCKLLSLEELNCENLNTSNPKCTVSILHGHLYFALTAYNAQVESGYTRELNLIVNPKNLAAVQQSITTILLKEN